MLKIKYIENIPERYHEPNLEYIQTKMNEFGIKNIIHVDYDKKWDEENQVFIILGVRFIYEGE